jgi:hypothetical protein
VPRSLSPEHPNLVRAATRLRRILLAWAGLFGGAGLLSLAAQPGVAPVFWLLGAILIVVEPQPALLGMVSVCWGLSLLGVSPELNRAIGLDPVGSLFSAGWAESLSLGFVRLILAVMAWNQFLFYRLLYGTRSMTGLAAELPDVPEVIPNRTGRLNTYAWAAWLVGGLTLLSSSLPAAQLILRPLRTASLGLAALSIGLGVGVAFSPTHRRGTALAAIVLGSFVLLASVAALRE